MGTNVFSRLAPQPPDGLLRLIGEYRADSRKNKIDLGVGVYRNALGETPILETIKIAERRLVDNQPTKAYLGPEGNPRFAAALKKLVFGAEADGRTVAVQTPGGTGAVRLALDLIKAARPDATVWVGTPTWPNHLAMLHAVGLKVETFPAYDFEKHEICFDAYTEALSKAAENDVVLLHGCCHNPTGADFTAAQWAEISGLLVKHNLLPMIDLAYQGLGAGFDADGAGMRQIVRNCDEVLVAYSCDKNFALYRDRVGALFLKAPDANMAETGFSNMLALARTNWSMPPDHGAAAVQIILEDAKLAAQWGEEVEIMRGRINKLRTLVAETDARLAYLGHQHGMFSLLPLSKAQVATLKADFGIYMAASGRVNVAGFTEANIPYFIEAFRKVAD